MTTLASHYGGLELNSPNDVVVDSSASISPIRRMVATRARACCLVWESRAPNSSPFGASIVLIRETAR